MEYKIGKNNIRAEKNKLIYYLDYNYIFNKYKNNENKYYYNNIELINNITSFFLLYGIIYVKDIITVLNNLFTEDCKCIINDNIIETKIFMKLLFLIYLLKKYIQDFHINNLNITPNKIFNDNVKVDFKNKKM